MNSVLVDRLIADEDPRLEVYVGVNDAGEYRGKPSGYVDVPNEDYNYANVSPLGDFYLRPELPGFFMSNSELKFLMAEAATKNLISGDANQYFIEGINASMEFNEVDGSEYVSGKFLQSNTAIALQQIAEQNWVGLYTQGIEAWTEWRRTGYPILTPAFEADLTEIPSRYNYPAIENSINKTSVDAAVAAQGPDNLTTKIWWMN